VYGKTFWLEQFIATGHFFAEREWRNQVTGSVTDVSLLTMPAKSHLYPGPSRGGSAKFSSSSATFTGRQ